MAQTPDELIVTLGNLATYHDLNKVSYIDGREMLCFGDVSGIDNEEEPEEEQEIQEEPEEEVETNEETQIEEDNLENTEFIPNRVNRQIKF